MKHAARRLRSWLISDDGRIGKRMATILRVELTMPPEEFLHQFRNFGEDVYSELKNECSVSIAEIDAATSVFYIRDRRAKFVRSAAVGIRKIALKHQIAGMIDVTEVPA